MLSQWWPARFVVAGDSYACAEHFMMAEKARLFGDTASRAEILAAADPAEVKALGRKVRGFDEQVWERERFHLVAAGSVAKFAQNPDLGGYLLSTGNAVLVEASPVDRIWG
ncbi:MAG TPA: NADAR family protein, partial [Hyphomicrobiaceae bacterium]|nr:NADAR family protein [Hyphomicrobiaceae bacterium]